MGKEGLNDAFPFNVLYHCILFELNTLNSY